EQSVGQGRLREEGARTGLGRVFRGGGAWRTEAVRRVAAVGGDRRCETCRERVRGRLEDLSHLPGNQSLRELPAEGVRRATVCVLRQGACGYAANGRAVEARDQHDERRAGRSGRQALRREIFPAGVEGALADDGEERDRGVLEAHRCAGVDGAGNEGGGKAQ